MTNEDYIHTYTVNAQHILNGFVNFKVVQVEAANSSAASYLARQELMTELGADADIRVTSSVRLA